MAAEECRITGSEAGDPAEEEVKLPGLSMEGQCHVWYTELSALRNEPAHAGCKGREGFCQEGSCGR